MASSIDCGTSVAVIARPPPLFSAVWTFDIRSHKSVILLKLINYTSWPDFSASRLGFVDKTSQIDALTRECKELFWNLNNIINDPVGDFCDRWDVVGINHGGSPVTKHRHVGVGIVLCIMLHECRSSTFATGDQTLRQSGCCLTGSLSRQGGFRL